MCRLSLYVFASLVLVVRSELYELPPPTLPDDSPTTGTNAPDNDVDEEILDDVTSGLQKRAEDYDYGEALKLSIEFFEAQRSGNIPEGGRVPWRHADSAASDSGPNGEDLSGGMYDAGDHVKFNLPMAFSTTMMAWSYIEFEDAYKSVGEDQSVRDLLKWNCDYFIKCHPSPDVYYYQVGNPNIDHSYWDRPENMTMSRPAYKIGDKGADVAAETAAALAGCAKVFEEHDQSYSDKCLNTAKSVLQFAENHRGLYPPDNYYISSKYWDEVAWGNAWVYWASGLSKYYKRAKSLFNNKGFLKGNSYAFGWNDKREGVKLLMGHIAQNDADRKLFHSYFKKYLNTWLPGGGVPYTAKGLACRHEWGSLRWAADSASLGILAARYKLRASVYRPWAKTQLDYILGSSGHSFVVGFGVNPPERPHHRASSCPDVASKCTNANSLKYDGPNHHQLKGAMVGGPDCNDQWQDNRQDYKKNEVACDYNAGFQTLASGVLSELLRGKTF